MSIKLEGIKVFRREHNTVSLNSWEIRIIDFVDNTFCYYLQDKTLGYVFQDVTVRPVEDMGYKDAVTCYKELKRRGYISDKDIIETEIQETSEIEGCWNLVIDRYKNHRGCGDILSKLINEYCLLDTDVMTEFHRRTKGVRCLL